MTASTSVGNSGNQPQWDRVQSDLREFYGQDIHDSWFKRIVYEGLTDGTVELSVPTPFVRHWLQTHYSKDVLSRLQKEDESVTGLRISVRGAGRSPRPAAAAPNQNTGPQQAAGAPNAVNVAQQQRAPLVPGLEGSSLDQRFQFSTMAEGAPNALAVAAAKKIALAQPGQNVGFNLLFFHGLVGLGKTHLLQAMAQEAGRSSPGRRVLYLTSEHFMYRFVAALKARNTLTFKDVLRDIDCLLIDDLQFLNGQKVTEEFGHTLSTLMDSGRQIVIAADRPPADLDGLDTRVRSRLGSGLVVELQAPDYPMRREILGHRIAVQRELCPDLDFPEEVLDFVARSVTTNGRDLDGAVTRLVANNQLTGAPISLAMAETTLRDLLRARESRKPKIEDIQRVVSTHYAISKHDLVSSRRTRNIVRPRQIAMYLSKTLTPRSLPEIGRRFGNRDHTTVLHAVRKIESLTGQDPKIAEDIETLKRLLDN